MEINGYFPMLIQICEGNDKGLIKRIAHHEIPTGVAFKVLKMKVSDEMYKMFILGFLQSGNPDSWTHSCELENDDSSNPPNDDHERWDEIWDEIMEETFGKHHES